MSEDPTRLRLGNASLDRDRGLLRRADGTETVLRPKTLGLLCLLAEHGGRLVTREEILDAVWPGIAVTDDSITQCVVEIRRALGPDAGLLRTMPRRGYMLELPTPAPGEVRPTPPSAPPWPSGSTPVVAVLPFRQFAPDPELALFGVGVLEGVVGALATLREPIVISANTTLRLEPEATEPRGVGLALGAGYVASGTLRRAGERIRLTAELADARSAAVVWQRSYDVTDGNSFDTQDRIAAIIANILAPRVQDAELAIARRRRPGDLGAYHLVLEARSLMFRMDAATFDQAGARLRRAVAADPASAPAWAEMAVWHGLRIGQGWAADREEETRALEDAIERALSLDPSHPRALAMAGHNHTILRRRHEDALALFDLALGTAPNDAETLMWSAPTFAFLGEGREAVRRAERAIALSPQDPLAFRYAHFLSIAHYAANDVDAAAAWGLRSLRANPDYTSNLRMTAAALAAAGRLGEARPLARRVMELEPRFRVGALVSRLPFRDPAIRRRYGDQLIATGMAA